MRLVKPKVEILNQGTSLEDVIGHIELCARTSYKSYDKATESNQGKLFERLINMGHLSPLEHGTLYLKINRYDEPVLFNLLKNNKFTFTNINADSFETVVFTTNARVIIEHGYSLDSIEKYMVNPSVSTVKRVTVRMNLPIAISREFNRHRAFSVTEQSTRFCNYSKDRFSNEITFIEPLWYTESSDDVKKHFVETLEHIEKTYMYLVNEIKPQNARDILALITHTEVVYTATIQQWEAFFKLRCAVNAHPMAQYLANKTKDELTKLNLL